MITIDRIFSVGEIKVQYQPDFTAPRYPITCSRDVNHVMRELWSDSMSYCEEFYIVCLSRSNEVIGFYKVSQGGISGTVADPKIIFQVALGCHASAIILAHNHPSGNLTPSEADKQLTRKIKEIGKFLECPVLDHLIVTPQGPYFSFADEGIL